MSEKLYIGRCEQVTNKFGGVETKIGYTKEHLDLLYSKLNEKGWVNTTIRSSKEGKPYQEIYVPKGATESLPF
jgi:hypothetical protein